MANKIFEYKYTDMYPLYVQKALKKNRTEEEVLTVITWLTGYNLSDLNNMSNEVNLEEFFKRAPKINPNAKLIKGSVCGVKVHEIEDPIIQQIRYLDKLVDELAKGKPLEKILRK